MAPGTLAHTAASAIAKVLKEKGGLNTLVQPTAGETVLIPMVAKGEIDLGIANMLEVLDGIETVKLQNDLRTTGSIYTLRIGFFSRKDSGIVTVADLKGMARNLAMSLSLYSGQMCTTPQNLFVPRAGITAGGQTVSFDDVVASIVTAIDGLLGDPARGAATLGAIATDATLRRIDEENAKPGVVRKSAPYLNPEFPDARVRTPLVAVVDAADRERYDREAFGPIAFVVRTANTDESLRLATSEAHPAKNPRGWFLNAADVDTTTPGPSGQ